MTKTEKDDRLQQWEIEHWTRGVENALAHTKLGVVFPVQDPARVKASDSYRRGYAVGLQLAGQIPEIAELPDVERDDYEAGEVQSVGGDSGTGGMHEVPAPRLVPPDRAATELDGPG